MKKFRLRRINITFFLCGSYTQKINVYINIYIILYAYLEDVYTYREREGENMIVIVIVGLSNSTRGMWER
jgi:hypothetical protein